MVHTDSSPRLVMVSWIEIHKFNVLFKLDVSVIVFLILQCMDKHVHMHVILS